MQTQRQSDARTGRVLLRTLRIGICGFTISRQPRRRSRRNRSEFRVRLPAGARDACGTSAQKPRIHAGFRLGQGLS